MPLEQLTLVLALLVLGACLISSIALVLGKPLDAVSKQVGCELYTRYVHNCKTRAPEAAAAGPRGAST